MTQPKPESLAALVERLDREFDTVISESRFDLMMEHEWPRLRDALREMRARIEDHDCFGDIYGGPCGRCAFLDRLDNPK